MNRKERRMNKMQMYERFAKLMNQAAENIRHGCDPDFHLQEVSLDNFNTAVDSLAQNAISLRQYGLQFNLPPEVTSRIHWLDADAAFFSSRWDMLDA